MRKNAHSIKVAVNLPLEIVYRQVARSVKNFAVLFVASTFMAGLFLQLAGTLQSAGLRNRAGLLDKLPTILQNEMTLRIVKPVFLSRYFSNIFPICFCRNSCTGSRGITACRRISRRPPI